MGELMKKNSIFNEKTSYFNSFYYIRKGFERFLKENSGDLNINRAESRFLSEIYYNEGISQREIAHNLFVSEANIAKTYKKLEGKGLIYKNVDENNNTRRQLYLTEKGEAAFEEIIDLYENYNKSIVAGYSEDEIKASKKILSEIAEKSLKLLE